MKIISNMIEAHIFCKKKNGIEFLLLKRNEKEIYPGLWQMVTGKIRKGEKAYKTALREIKEETGLKPKRFWVTPNVNPFYSHEKNYISLISVFVAEVAEDSKIVICKEHSEFRWLNPGKAKEMLAWPGQRRSVDIITQYFTKDSFFWNFVELKVR
ncbi:MAG: NUDIX pyrophosphatase [Ignavibacteria bacterium GWA2_35_9]|nr:MAG: NUDIX pyrophosphatase [Ignavibacteria bacterium GWA2_35_9]OGU43692.1 MAG: NUDIX pyrophosphatase [Ignavibacteria bacterium GWB2_36_8]OGU52922.1 MAG: NUDIX pyrophosphatase [Ignavibacteria bacterium GWC2_36_12]